MNKFIIGLLLSTTAFAGSLEVRYSTKDIVFLKGSKGQFKELKGTRVRKPNLNVVIKNDDSTTEKFKVSLDQAELRKINNYLKIHKSKGGLKVGHGKKNITLTRNGKGQKLELSVSSSKKLLAREVRKDISHIIKGIDQNIDLNKMQLKISRASLSCTSLKSANVTCLMQTRAKAIVKTSENGPKDRLAIHLNDLRSEMKKASGTDYDIEGYREFLTKSEKLVSEVLDSKNKHNKNALLSLKQMIIDERIDSYEFSAIRSKSVLTFVNKALKKLKS